MKLYMNWKFAMSRLMTVADGYFSHPFGGYKNVNYAALPGHLALIARDLLAEEA